MTMIKLDSGFLLNPAALAYVSSDEMLAYFKRPVIINKDSYQTERCFGLNVTKADIERIAGSATNREVTDDEQ
ncbi:hypothetical protein OK107_06600 [Lacticaseibacillus paracasei]|uniref:hypothetical protein n=1 Tax=Lacticaseibacillus paracasei TaxID=1597 RepID=UPI0022EC2283|nr:hypothetical protein [Lacticaseibacillus paracasei]WBT00353.1 hypothetical protein OK107_06600 [Lacticaseibacillus paracasei]